MFWIYCWQIDIFNFGPSQSDKTVGVSKHTPHFVIVNNGVEEMYECVKCDWKKTNELKWMDWFKKMKKK